MERPCPGENVTFTCTISAPGHQWNILSHGIFQSLLPRDQGRVIFNPPLSVHCRRGDDRIYYINCNSECHCRPQWNRGLMSGWYWDASRPE